MDAIEARKAIKELTMMLMYLTKFSEESRFFSANNLSWKGYNFEVMHDLEDNDFIDLGKYSSKKLCLTDKGIDYAKSLLNHYQIADWPNGSSGSTEVDHQEDR